MKAIGKMTVNQGLVSNMIMGKIDVTLESGRMTFGMGKGRAGGRMGVGGMRVSG